MENIKSSQNEKCKRGKTESKLLLLKCEPSALTLQYNTDFKTEKSVCFSCYQHVPSFELNCYYSPSQKQCSLHAVKKKRHTPYPTSQSEAPFTDLMHSNCNFLFPLVQSLALFPHSHSSFAHFFFLLSPSVCIHLHYFLHSCLHPPQSGFDCQLSSPFFFFISILFAAVKPLSWLTPFFTGTTA